MTPLSDAERGELIQLAGLLDGAERPVPASRLPPEPRLRNELEAMLARRGRVLVTVDLGDDMTYATSSVDDDIAAQLAEAGIGILDARCRAVLALVLLRCVVEPAAQGRPPVAWSEAARVPNAKIKSHSRMHDSHITAATQRLHLQGLVDWAPVGIRPGPALERLTPTQRHRVERDLLEIVAGHDPLIRRVLDRLDADDQRNASDDQQQRGDTQ